MKRGAHRREESDALLHAVFVETKLILAQIGYVQAIDVGGDYRNRNQVRVDLDCFDRLLRFRRRGLRRGLWLLWLRSLISLTRHLRDDAKRSHEANDRGDPETNDSGLQDRSFCVCEKVALTQFQDWILIHWQTRSYDVRRKNNVCLATLQYELSVAALPPDVRKGCAFPSSPLAAKLRLTSLRQERDVYSTRRPRSNPKLHRSEMRTSHSAPDGAY